MKFKKISIQILILICLVSGTYGVFKIQKTNAQGGDDDDAPPPAVGETVVSVQVGKLKRMTLHRYVSGYGVVEAEPASADQLSAGGSLSAPTAGIVAKVNVTAGQEVKRSDVLIELNSSATSYEYAQREVERQKKLLEQQNTSLKNVQNAEAQLALLQVVAPVDGTVTNLPVKQGQSVDTNMVVAEVMDLHRLAVVTKIPVAQAHDLKVGQKMVVSDAPNHAISAEVKFISPTVDPKDETVSVWSALPANDDLRPGEFVNLKIETETQSDCLVAPAESVTTNEDGKNVLTMVVSDIAEQKPVETGLSEDDWVAVKAPGIKAGDEVVTAGAYGLPDKTKIKIVSAESDAAENSPNDSENAQ